MLEQYYKLISNNLLKFDDSQVKIVERMHSLIQKVKGKPIDSSNRFKGFYVFGSSGTGKTVMLDTFYNSIKQTHKSNRFHWNCFMSLVHQEIHSCHSRGSSSPIQDTANSLSQNFRILCLDEVQHCDPASYRLISSLFSQLFSTGTILIATSNRHLSEIIPESIRKENNRNKTCFSALLAEHCEICRIQSNVDYRQSNSMENTGRTYFTWSVCSKSEFEELFNKFSCNEYAREASIMLPSSRIIRIPRAFISGNRACFYDCDQLLRGTLGPSDYWAICENYPVIFLANLPRMYPRQDPDIVRRLITFIDAVYDCRAKIYILAEADINELFYIEDAVKSDYVSDEMFSIGRALSRLHEITGSAYHKKLEIYSNIDDNNPKCAS